MLKTIDHEKWITFNLIHLAAERNTAVYDIGMINQLIVA